MKSTLIYLIMLLFVVIACNNNSNNKIKDDEMHSQSHDNEHNISEVGTIELDNGAKWKVNEEMKPHIVKGEEILKAYINNKNNNYKLLANEIYDANLQLINSCTMDGKSHEELHKWLHPHLEIVENLKKCKDNIEADKFVKDLEISYKTYHQYFQ